ncbi:thermonuclease family protein, partial [Candidatus Gottesmanbacteria bacterium]|nr:thermonuclease family protein [Candidatus Gottesmanbacteria bacterium]
MKRSSRVSSIVSKLAFIFLPLLLLSFGLNIYFFQKIKSENTVVEVIDGDTFQLRSGKRVRLLGVDAPEYNRCGGPEAKKRLKELIGQKIIDLREVTTEAYGRSLALVYAGSVFVNRVMLEEGWARTDYRKNSQREVL